MSVLIKGGRIVTAADDYVGDVFVENGSISRSDHDERRAELQQLVAAEQIDSSVVARVRGLYQEAGVFEKAGRLVDKYRQRAEAVADEIEPEELRQLLYYLIDTVLADDGHSEADQPQILVESIAPYVA